MKKRFISNPAHRRLIGFLFLAVLLVVLPTCIASAASYYGLIQRGNRYYKNELYREALNNYLEGKERNEKAIEPAFNAGDAYYRMEDYINAIDQLAAALQNTSKDTKKTDIHYNLGNSYFQLGQYEKAAEQYMKGLELSPYNLNLKYNLELALKKLKEAEEKKAEQSMDGEDASKPRQGDKGLQKGAAGASPPKEKPADAGKEEKQKQSVAAESDKKHALTKEEAERIINSLNTDQTAIIGDQIKQRLGSSENEKDW